MICQEKKKKNYHSLHGSLLKILRSVQDLNLRAKENLVRRISSPVHYHSANTP